MPYSLPTQYLKRVGNKPILFEVYKQENAMPAFHINLPGLITCTQKFFLFYL